MLTVVTLDVGTLRRSNVQTLDDGRWTLGAGRWTLDVGRCWTLDVGCWTSGRRDVSCLPFKKKTLYGRVTFHVGR